MVFVDDNHAGFGCWVSMAIDADYDDGDAAFGVMLDGEPVAGVLLKNWNGSNLDMHMRINHPAGFTRKLIRRSFKHAFVTLGAARVTAVIRISNQRSIDLCRRIGFRVEGVLKEYYPGGDGIVIMVMWPENCRYLRN